MEENSQSTETDTNISQVQNSTSVTGGVTTKGKNKFIWPLILLGLAALVMVGLLLFLSQRKTPTSTQNLQQITEQVRQQKASSGKIIADYLYAQKRNDGYNNLLSHFEEICGGQNEQNCPFGEKNVFEINNSWSALGFFSAYKMSGSQKDLDQSRLDIEKLKEFCVAQISDCLWVFAQPALIAMDSNSDVDHEFLREAADKLLTTKGQENVMLLSIEARELALAYEIFKEEQYLISAKERYTQAKSSYDSGVTENALARETNPLQACWVTLAAAELARATKERIYIDEAAKVHTDENIRKKKYTNPFAVNVQPCIETHYLVYVLTGDKTYYDEGLRLLRHVEINFHDTKEKSLAWGEGGIVAVNPKSVGMDRFYKQVNVTDSSYMLYLLYLFSPKE